MSPHQQNGKIIVFTGPVASGKTTQRLLLSQYIGKKFTTLTFTFSPFSLTSYAVLSLLKSLTLVSHSKLKWLNRRKSHSMAFLETVNKPLVTRILKLLVLLDLIQETEILFLLNILLRLGIYVFVEDFVPTVTLEHILYLKLYRGESISTNRLIGKLFRIMHRIFSEKLSAKVLCIHLQSSSGVRLLRSIKRGRGIIDSHTMHDYVHEQCLMNVTSNMCRNLVVIETSDMSVVEVFREILDQIGTAGLLR